MSRILAIDPGSEQSAWLVLTDGQPDVFGITENEALLRRLRAGGAGGINVIVIEKIESYGMAVGREIFDTVWWTGRFTEAVYPMTVTQLPRRAVKLAICGDSKAKDANIRQALIDRFGGPESIRKGGALYKISKDVWSALAIAVTYRETFGLAPE